MLFLFWAGGVKIVFDHWILLAEAIMRNEEARIPASLRISWTYILRQGIHACVRYSGRLGGDKQSCTWRTPCVSAGMAPTDISERITSEGSSVLDLKFIEWIYIQIRWWNVQRSPCMFLYKLVCAKTWVKFLIKNTKEMKCSIPKRIRTTNLRIGAMDVMLEHKNFILQYYYIKNHVEHPGYNFWHVIVSKQCNI